MKKQIYLLRHAHAEDKQIDQGDKQRELTQRGMQECVRLASMLRARDVVFDAVLSSSAARAVETCRLISEVIGISQEKISFMDELYDGSVRTYVQAIQSIDSSLNNMLLIGHNPTITYLAEYLTGAEVGDMPTCSLSVISFNTEWQSVTQGGGTLKESVSPSDLNA